MQYGLVVFPRSRNSGDAIQSIAAMRHLPRVDRLLDREGLSAVKTGAEHVKVIGNGWYLHNTKNWPPSADLDFLPVSMHFAAESVADVFAASNREYWHNSPYRIGARDLDTLFEMNRHGINAYFSGCLTLTLEPRAKIAGSRIVICDVSPEVEAFVRAESPFPVDQVSHLETSEEPIDVKLLRAEKLLLTYASAHCVITSRLHAALPSLAMGTPTYFITEGAWDGHYRFRGLADLVHSGGAHAVLDKTYDFVAPPPNPTRHLELRRQLIEDVQEFLSNRTATRGGQTPTNRAAWVEATALPPLGDDCDSDEHLRNESGNDVRFGTTAEGEPGTEQARPSVDFAQRISPEGALISEISRLQADLDVKGHELSALRNQLDANSQRLLDAIANAARLQTEADTMRDHNNATASAELAASNEDRRRMAAELAALQLASQTRSVPEPVARLYRGLRRMTPNPLARVLARALSVRKPVAKPDAEDSDRP